MSIYSRSGLFLKIAGYFTLCGLTEGPYKPLVILQVEERRRSSLRLNIPNLRVTRSNFRICICADKISGADSDYNMSSSIELINPKAESVRRAAALQVS